MTRLLLVITAAGNRTSGAHFIIECQENLEPSVQQCLEGLGISLLSEVDVLAFVYRHGVTLGSVEQIASLVGYEIAAVDSAIEQLEREKLMERSRSLQGVCFFRFLTPSDAEHRRCLQQLISLLETRVGRMLVTKRLRLAGPGIAT